MKIKFWDRVILFLGGLLTIAAGFFLVVAGLQFQGSIGESLPVWARTVCIVCGVFTAMFGVYVLAFPHRRLNRRQDFVVQKSDNGELRIAVKAIESQVRKCIDLHEEIRLDSIGILNSRSGVTVDLRIALANNISIPLAVASLQKQIKQYLAASSGIEIKEVRVSVESTDDELESHPAPKGDGVPPPEEEQVPAPRKRSLHQRIFDKPEQPAILPEPPKEDGDTMAAWRPPETEFARDKTKPEEENVPAPSAPLTQEPDTSSSAPGNADGADNPQPDEEMEDHSHE